MVKERFRVCQVDGIPKNNCVGFDKQTLSMTGTQFYNLKNYGLKCSMPTARIEPKRLDIAQGEQGSLRCITEGNLYKQTLFLMPKLLPFVAFRC